MIAGAFRIAGDALVDALNEAGTWGPKGPLPLTYGEVHGACEDLDHLVAFLEEVAAERIGSALDPISERLSSAASGWAGRLAQLVLDMRRTLGEMERSQVQEDRSDAEPEGDA